MINLFIDENVNQRPQKIKFSYRHFRCIQNQITYSPYTYNKLAVQYHDVAVDNIGHCTRLTHTRMGDTFCTKTVYLPATVGMNLMWWGQGVCQLNIDLYENNVNYISLCVPYFVFSSEVVVMDSTSNWNFKTFSLSNVLTFWSCDFTQSEKLRMSNKLYHQVPATY